MSHFGGSCPSRYSGVFLSTFYVPFNACTMSVVLYILVRLSSTASKFLFSEASSDIKGDNILVAGNPHESTITLDEDDLRHATFKLPDFGAGNSTARYDGKASNFKFFLSKCDGEARCGVDPTWKPSGPRSANRSRMGYEGWYLELGLSGEYTSILSFANLISAC